MTLIERLRGELDAVGVALLERGSGGVLILDDRGLLVRANGAVRDMAGPDVRCAAGMPALDLFAAADRAALWQRWRACLLDGLPAAPVAAWLMRAGGEDLPVELSPAALREPDGRASGLIVQVRDLSPRRRLEAELAHGQKLQAVGQLAAGIAHDFNNLLTAILGAAETIEGRAEVGAPTRQDASDIRGAAERGAALVRQLLAFGRQQALQPRAICVNDAIGSLAGLLGRLLGGGIALTLDLDAAADYATVDPGQLDQVLINLACNARDAMPGGGTLTLRSGHIAFFRPLVSGPETIPPGRYVMIEVQDTGAGIDPEVLPRIFDPFFTTRRERGGTGLGLSTVHGIIRQSRGFLGVESEPGSGTRVRVYLPRCDAGVAPAAQPAPPALPACPAHKRVLLVDDEESVRRLAQRALTQAGWRVAVADSAEAALELLDKSGQGALGELDLLISDVAMPGMDGPALARQLRRRWPALPVLLVTGYADERLRETLAESATEILLKPYGLAELVRRAAQLTGLGAVAEAGDGVS